MKTVQHLDSQYIVTSGSRVDTGISMVVTQIRPIFTGMAQPSRLLAGPVQRAFG